MKRFGRVELATDYASPYVLCHFLFHMWPVAYLSHGFTRNFDPRMAHRGDGLSTPNLFSLGPPTCEWCWCPAHKPIGYAQFRVEQVCEQGDMFKGRTRQKCSFIEAGTYCPPTGSGTRQLVMDRSTAPKKASFLFRTGWKGMTCHPPPGMLE